MFNVNDDGQAGRKGDAPRAEPRSPNVFQAVNPRPGAQPRGRHRPTPIRVRRTEAGTQ